MEYYGKIFSGPLSSVLSMKYSYKTVTMIGGFFAATGMMVSYFANSVPYLYVSYGIMVGIGAGLTCPVSVYIVTEYFEKYRGFANGMCISGSCFGAMLLPPLLQYLLDTVGYRGAVLIMGAITLNSILCGMLYHPVERHMKRVPLTIEKSGIDNKALTLDESKTTTQSVLQSEKSILQNEKPVVQSDQTTLQSDETNLEFDKPILQTDQPILHFTPSKSIPLERYRKFSSPDYPLFEKISTPDDRIEDATEERGNKPKMNDKCSEDSDEPSGDSLPIHEKSTSQIKTQDFFTANSTEKYSLPLNENPSTQRSTLPRIFRRLCTNQLSKKSWCAAPVCKIDSLSNDLKTDPEKQEEIVKKKKFFDLSILKDPIYLVILTSNATSAISNTNFMILLPSYAIAEGFDKNSAALLLSIVSALDLIGRIGGASLSDIDFIPKYYYFVGGLGMSGIALALLPMATSYRMLSFFCGLFGISSGTYIGITTVVLADMLGAERLSSSYGIALFVNGVLQLLGPPIIGVIYEEIGSYKPIFLALGIILILGTSLWAIVPVVKRRKQKELEAN
ncbi:monocarboxylate transporter 5-like isoform X2 [Belonocnema kinseyi]|uniref:monocarboxylate transporter 5-like isoform X2 n=1 Tax=Belonocnema kinseyi TaxID=2817044 RepID=UPI00143CD954|nr:monocarboxylate transporter 5-like isoform X2 [Belonocnema kinseyi]